MVYTKEERGSEGLRGERGQIKFIDLRLVYLHMI